MTATYENVGRLEVETAYGDDVVRYKLDGTVVRHLDVDVYLGHGNNRFTGTLNRDISADDRLRVSVFGGDDADLITLYGTPTAPNRADDHLTDGLAINDGGLRVGAGGELEVNINGGRGNDRIFVDYVGELDGTLDVAASGYVGDDLIRVGVRLQAGSGGQVGTVDEPSGVYGDAGSDRLAFYVFDDSGNSRPVYAAIDGGEDFWGGLETDRGSRTANVSHAGGLEILETI